jgi:asparagine synthase (glutamine-hydrolysing)
MGRIVGVASRVEDNNPGELLSFMGNAIPYRGALTTKLERVSNGSIALGLITGDQSYDGGISEVDDGNYLIVYYGFFPDLDKLFNENELPASTSAGENFISLYKLHGIDFLRMIPGMFTIVLYDAGRNRLLVATDRNGYFPVYYSLQDKRLIFSSSIKPVKALLDTPHMNSSAVVEHLFFDALYGNRTYYDDINILEYGAYLVFDRNKNKLSTEKYFRYEDLFDPEEYRRNKGIDAPAELIRILKSSLGRIVSNKDLQTFGLSCGGGLDCSLVGAVMKESGFKVPVFCSNVSGGQVSEEQLARETAKQMQTDIHIGQLTSKQFYPLLLKSIVDFQQPIVHPNSPKFYVVVPQEISHKRFNQIFGVASDLLFGGFRNGKSYMRYLKLRRLLKFLPHKIRRLLGASVNEIAVVNTELRMKNKLNILSLLGMGNFERASMQRSIENALSEIKNPEERYMKVMLIENLCEYQQHLLNRRFELSATNGISLYFPFLDLEMIRFAINLPVEHCVDFDQSKIVIRKAAIPYLGTERAGQMKWGGDVPLENWIPPLKFLLGDGFLREAFRFDSGVLDHVFIGNPGLLWNIIDLELWGRMCLYGQSPDNLVAEMQANGIDCDPFE